MYILTYFIFLSFLALFWTFLFRSTCSTLNWTIFTTCKHLTHIKESIFSFIHHSCEFTISVVYLWGIQLMSSKRWIDSMIWDCWWNRNINLVLIFDLIPVIVIWFIVIFCTNIWSCFLNKKRRIVQVMILILNVFVKIHKVCHLTTNLLFYFHNLNL